MSSSKWTLWSLDCVMNEEGLWEFNDRSATTVFECQLDDDAGDEECIEKLLTALEEQRGFDFLTPIKSGKAYADFDVDGLWLYDRKSDYPEYHIENDVAVSLLHTTGAEK